MKNFWIGLLTGLAVGICLVPLGAYFLARMGAIPVATNAKPVPFERTLARTALRAAMHPHRQDKAPIVATDENLTAGAKLYGTNCAACHGLPNQAGGAIAKGMFPIPPQLFDPDQMVTDDPIGVTFWKAKKGIRLTGMPGFEGSLTDEQIWQVSLLLANADKLSPKVRDALK